MSILEKLEKANSNLFRIWVDSDEDILLESKVSKELIYIFEKRMTSLHKRGELSSLYIIIREMSDIIQKLFGNICLPDKLDYTVVDNKVYCNGVEVGLKRISEEEWEAYPVTVEDICVINSYLEQTYFKESSETGIKITDSLDADVEESVSELLLED